MNKKLLIFLMIVAFVGCRQSDNIRIEEKKYVLKSQICGHDDCAKVEIDIPYFLSNNQSVELINNEILRQVALWVSFADNEEQFADYDQLMQNFISSYEKIKTDFPNEPIPWKAEIEVEAERLNNELVNVTYDCYTFTGGAHGNHGKMSRSEERRVGKECKCRWSPSN